jgi:hypothetical protein
MYVPRWLALRLPVTYPQISTVELWIAGSDQSHRPFLVTLGLQQQISGAQ